MNISVAGQLEVAFYLLLAAILGTIIGLERERRGKSAGIRTHMLVAMGAALFTILSMFAFPDGDPTRVASNIVTGIGFLGAGVIFTRKGEVHDLTTAASIWATAAIGMAAGAQLWFLAILCTLMVWIILGLMRDVPQRAHEWRSKNNNKDEK